MSYIITDDSHYQAIGEALQRKRGEEKSYLPSEMAAAINTIPSTADGTDLPVQAIYWTNPDDTGRPTECDIVNWHTDTPLSWLSILARGGFTKVKTIRFINCDNISGIGNSAFQSCSSLASITIPNSVASIGQGAFQYCTSLASITLPNSVASIEQYAFNGCSSLASITIPNSVASIGNSAFQYCTSLTDVYYTGAEDDWNKISIGANNTPLTNATIHYNYSE